MAELIEQKKNQIEDTKKMEAQKPVEIKQEETKIEHKKEEKKQVVKKDSAIAKAFNLSISPKYSKYICNMIRGKDIDTAQKMLEEVVAYKRVVKMHGLQVPHKHGKGIMAGRYPITATKEFITLIKQLKANGIHNELEMEKYIIAGNADVASKPYKRGGARFKRTHVTLRLEKNLKAENKKQEKKEQNKKLEAKK